MEVLPWILLGAAVLTAALLGVKIHLMRRAAEEIARGFADRLTTDTNTLIDISTRDRAMRSLASRINRELRRLRSQRRRYQQGDLELKAAVTNISHDLRTPLTAICGYLELLEQEDKSPQAAELPGHYQRPHRASSPSDRGAVPLLRGTLRFQRHGGRGVKPQLRAGGQPGGLLC